ncbi:hypothetical protein M3Y98_00864600 [Aphelenchoides besseyi]|nr:hypothetical protein M3Y98_00864600 [Aphelenchoides besseyi]KAI6211215.1 hypothetical protein M3Y96_00410200 [Aphelenchoides besseyi]
MIGIWMNKTRESKRSEAIGQIEFGGYDEKCSGSLTAIPIVNSNWAFAINKGQIAMDSDRIGIPIQFYNPVVKATEAVWNDDLRSYVIDCDKNFPIKFTIKTVKLILETVDYTTRIGDQRVLELEENFGPNGRLVSLGNKWLSRYCAISDVKKKQSAFTSISLST